jgi:DNA polymerase III subunit delta
MAFTAQQLFKELEGGAGKPIYAVVGDEPFQAGEIAVRAKAIFAGEEGDAALNYEAWDGEGLDGSAFRRSLETLPGLFDGPETRRLILCPRFDRATAGALEPIADYFDNPVPSTCLILFAAKADKRKHWYRAVEAQGAVLEIHEPHERDWPKWLAYFERRCGKRIEPEAWERLVESGGRRLAAVWNEVQKAAAFAGESPRITIEDSAAAFAVGGADVFELVEDVACRRAFPAMRRFQELRGEGESEIKLLALLVRQFRLIDGYRSLTARGVTDNKTLASELRIPPFVLAKVKGQSHFHPEGVAATLELLAECDYRLKSGEGSLFEQFFVRYFPRVARRAPAEGR